MVLFKKCQRQQSCWNVCCSNQWIQAWLMFLEKAKYSLSINHGDLQRNISTDGVRYLKFLIRQVEAQTMLTRNKRKASFTWRVRQEIRTLSETQRSRIFGCLNRLKRDNVSLLYIIIHVLFEHNYPFFIQQKSEHNQSDFNFFM